VLLVSRVKNLFESVFEKLLSHGVGGPSGPSGRTVRDLSRGVRSMFTSDWSVCLYCGPSGPWGRTVRSPDQRGSPSAQSLYNCADCSAGVGGPSADAKLVWAGTVCFGHLYYRLSGA
jgi:nicotinamide mononucleotide (NMN) deamidase PncC